jgi:hypothetical protein
MSEIEHAAVADGLKRANSHVSMIPSYQYSASLVARKRFIAGRKGQYLAEQSAELFACGTSCSQ